MSNYSHVPYVLRCHTLANDVIIKYKYGLSYSDLFIYDEKSNHNNFINEDSWCGYKKCKKTT